MTEWVLMPEIGAEERRDAAAAREVIHRVFDGVAPAAKEAYITFLAGAVDYLGQHHADNWGITLFASRVRLNVGQVECLALHPFGLRILVETESAPPGTKPDGTRYVKAPGCDMVTLPLSELQDRLGTFAESNRAAMSITAKSQATRAIRNAHSPGLIDFLSNQVGRRLPNPSYHSTPEIQSLSELDEQPPPEPYEEGCRKSVLVNRFERDPRARAKCVDHYGPCCSVCGMTFAERYGNTMDGFIHVHHVRPLASIGEAYEVDPIADLRPVCPNCHAVLHHGNPPISIEQARTLVARRSAAIGHLRPKKNRLTSHRPVPKADN